MNAFAFVDLLSQYDSGVGTQTERLTTFLESRLGIDREAASVAVQMWRHTLMHGGNPRPLPRSQGGDLAEGRYLWLPHWGEPWLRSPDNMTLVNGGSDRILNLGLSDFVADLRLAAESLLDELSLTTEGRSCVEAVEQRIARAPIA